MPTEVFVSHSHVDQEFAEQLVGVLRRHRIPVWYSDTDIQGAQQWHDEIGRRLRESDTRHAIPRSDDRPSKYPMNSIL